LVIQAALPVQARRRNEDKADRAKDRSANNPRPLIDHKA